MATQSNPFIADHPLIQHKVTLLRNKDTSSKQFRELIKEITELMVYEATRDLPVEEVAVETPITTAKSKVIAGRKLAFVPIPRAGLGMVEERDVIVLDPMLATGGSAVDAIDQIKTRHPRSIKFMCIIAAPEGLKVLTEKHPDVKVYCAAEDLHLNENGYIVPGLGDAGDRIFGTK